MNRWKDHRVQCLSCWRKGGLLCVSCRTTPERNEARYMHMCKACFGSLDDATHAKLTEEEVRKKTHGPTQTWTGSEPALQTLLLPLVQSERLPRYAKTPEYLHPDHCRLCFADCSDASGRKCASCKVVGFSDGGGVHGDSCVVSEAGQDGEELSGDDVGE